MARECIFRDLEAQGLKISPNHGGGKGEGELQDVTGLPKKTLDTSLDVYVTFTANDSDKFCDEKDTTELNIWKYVYTETNDISQKTSFRGMSLLKKNLDFKKHV